MTRLIVIRLLQLPVILAVIFFITFALAWALPGDPLQRPEGQRPPPEVALAMKKQFNMDSMPSFLVSYMKNLAKGDLGPSLKHRDQRVNDIIASGLPVSAVLGVASLFIALHIGLFAGIIGALKPGSGWDFSSLLIALVGISLPTFVTGAILLVVFAGLTNLLPPGGWGSPSHLILPAVALALAPAAYIARLVRLGLADVMGSDFIRTARAKGLSVKRALFDHAMKVAFLPVLSFLGPAAAATMTGSFVIEKVFAIPGLGEHFVNAVLNKDQFLILGLVLVYSTILVLFNLVVDVAYAWVDPRIEI
ncbi:MAG: ABC transporter permease [Phycisphaeraceae bacterium]